MADQPEGWEPAGDGRWTFPHDQERHLLLKDGGRFVEFHHNTVHVYEGPAEVESERWPLAAAHHVRSDVRDDLAAFEDEERLWQMLSKVK